VTEDVAAQTLRRVAAAQPGLATEGEDADAWVAAALALLIRAPP
jgi:hypothetical protein